MSTRIVSLSDITNLDALLQNGGPCVLSQGCPLQARALPLDLGAVPRPGLSSWLRVAGADASAPVLMAEHGAHELHRVLVQTLGRIEKAFRPIDVVGLVEIAVQQLQCDQRESRQLDRTAMVIIASAIALDYASSAEASIAIARQVWPCIRPLLNVPPPPALPLPYALLSPPPPSPARPPAPDHQAHEQLLPQPQQVQETAEVRRERRSRSWSGSSTSEEDNEEVGGVSSEAGEDDDAHAAGEVARRTGPAERISRHHLKRQETAEVLAMAPHGSTVARYAERLLGDEKMPSPVAARVPTLEEWATFPSQGDPLHPADVPLSFIWYPNAHGSLAVSAGGCGSLEHSTLLHFEQLDCVVLRGDFVHAGPPRPAAALPAQRRSPPVQAAPDTRIHGFVYSDAFRVPESTTDLCNEELSGTGFIATGRVDTREDVLASNLADVFNTLHTRGMCVIPRMHMPTSVVEAVDSLEATDWEPIFNNGDRLRQQTKEQAGVSWAQIAAQHVRAMLGEAGLLTYRSDGPMADRQEKVVGGVRAIRCLPGAGPQPAHVDVARKMHY